MNNTYNGWTNYATWRVNLEIFDGMNPQDYFTSTDEYDLALELQQYAQEIIESSSSGLAMHLAFSFLSEVNYREIAEHMIEEYELESEEA